MARGAPDDSNVLSSENLYRLDDLSELAVRLGSIVDYHRSGNVVLMDDFGSGIGGWYKHWAGAGVEIHGVNSESRSANLAARLYSGPAGGNKAGIIKYLPPLAVGKVGICLAFRLNSFVDKLEIRLDHYTLGQLYRYIVAYHPDTENLTYLDAAGDEVPFADVGELRAFAFVFHVVKIVLDLSAQTYHFTNLNRVEYSMVGLAPEPLAPTGDVYDELYVICWGLAPVGGEAFVDDVVITQNEE